MTMRTRAARFGNLSDVPAQSIGTLQVKPLVDNAPKRTVSISLISMKPHAGHPLLRHARTAEFFLVLEGSAQASIDNRHRRFKRGDFAFLLPGAIHKFRAGKNGVKVLTVFSPALDLKKPDILFCKR